LKIKGYNTSNVHNQQIRPLSWYG